MEIQNYIIEGGINIISWLLSLHCLRRLETLVFLRLQALGLIKENRGLDSYCLHTLIHTHTHTRAHTQGASAGVKTHICSQLGQLRVETLSVCPEIKLMGLSSPPWRTTPRPPLLYRSGSEGPFSLLNMKSHWHTYYLWAFHRVHWPGVVFMKQCNLAKRICTELSSTGTTWLR